MKFKKGVKIGGVCLEIAIALQVSESVYAELGFDLVVTSVCEGVHGPNSKHYDGEACDIRTRHLDKGVAERARDLIAARLTDEFDVVLEKTHLHVELDAKE